VISRVPLWAVLPLCALALFAVVLPLDLLVQAPETPSELATVLAVAPRALMISMGLLIPIAEGALWTVAFTEIFARWSGRPIVGAVVGCFAYGVLFHLRSGLWGILAATWLASVLALVYLVVRTRSKMLAFAHVVALRWLFVGYAFYVASSGG
jgi:hypothetical protein